jgi:mRNA-capping enzyme
MDNESYMEARAVSDVPMPDEEGVATPAAAAAAAAGGPPRHDDVLGEEVPAVLADQVLAAIRDMLRLPPSAAGAEFQGAQPVSLERANAGKLGDPAQHYMVSWKADGTRYLMLLMHGGAYLVDRAARVRRCQLRFPAPPPPGKRAGDRPDKPAYGTLHGVLLDGEMVVDALTPGGAPAVRRFLAYDCVAAGAAVPDDARGAFAERRFMERHAAISKVVVQPKKAYEAAAARRYRTDREPFRIRLKEFYPPERARWLLREFMPSLTHPADGLIFQPAVGYKARTNESLLKWKDPRFNSVDFFVHEEESTVTLCVAAGPDGQLKALQDVAPPPHAGEEDAAALAEALGAPLVWDAAEEGQTELLCAGCIAECVWDGDRRAWSLMRVRQDKEHPNHESVFLRVWQSIRDNLSGDDVLRLLEPAVEARRAKYAAEQAAKLAAPLA